MRLPNPHFPGFFKVVRTASWRMIYFLPCSHFSIEKFCRLSIAICMEKFSDDLHSLVAPIQRITAKTLHVASTESYPLVRTKQLFFQRNTALWNKLPHKYLLNLISASQQFLSILHIHILMTWWTLPSYPTYE